MQNYSLEQSAAPQSEYLRTATGEARQPERPFDSLLLKTHEEVIGFLDGCQQLADRIADEKPDIVFVPLRGAVPFVETARILLERNPEALKDDHVVEFVELALGERQTIDERPAPYKGESYRIRLFGPNKSVKEEIINNTFSNLEKAGTYKPGETRLMLVDEVQTGSTIETAAKSIAHAMERRGDLSTLTVVGMQDSRATKDEKAGRERSKGLTGKYREMLDTDRDNSDSRNIVTEAIQLPAFTVDVPSFLDEILWLQEDEELPSSYEKIENKVAKRMLNVLVNVYERPEEALQELLALRKSELASSLASTIIQAEIVENVTDPIPIRNRNAADARNSIDWWVGLTKKMIIKKRADEARIAS